MTNPASRLLIKVDQAASGLATDLFLYAASTAFALLTALTSTLLPHRAWGRVAVWAYAAATVVTLVLLVTRRLRASANEPNDAYGKRRVALTWITWVAACLVPLIVEAVQRAGGRTDRAQDEVLVVEQMGERLLHTGTPYVGTDAIAALPVDERLGAYSPYQPAMAVFGLPRAIFGDVWFADARIWFALVTAVALGLAVRLLPISRVRARAVQVVTVLPICALTLATGGDDLPVLALCLLALALVATDRHGWAGVAVGAAAACKLFAFPVVAVLVAMALASRNGRRLIPAAVGLPILVLIPPFLVDANAFVENVIRFPLGRGLVQSPAQSPFPGYLITQSVPGGRYIAAALLVTVGVVILVRLVRQPPRTATAAALISGYGLLAAILLMPTTRFGYLLYPAALLVWAPALSSYTAQATPDRSFAGYRR